MTALILIPKTDVSVNRREYIGGCITEAMKQGYAPLICYDFIYQILGIELQKYFDRILPSADIVLLFQDFSKGDLLARYVHRQQKDIPIKRMMIPNPQQYNITTLPAILKYVSENTGIPVEDMMKKTRKREIVDARFVYFRRAKEITGESLAKIGRQVDKDHASVLHGIHQASEIKQVRELYEKCFLNQ